MKLFLIFSQKLMYLPPVHFLPLNWEPIPAYNIDTSEENHFSIVELEF